MASRRVLPYTKPEGIRKDVIASLPHSREDFDSCVDNSLLNRFYLVLPKGQLWRLLVASADGPELGTERADEGTEEKVKSRQLGGMC